MKNLFDYKDFLKEKNVFLNEAKKANPLGLFKNDVKNILDDMFAKVKKPIYKYDSDGFPTEVEFEIVEDDFKVGYKKLENEFSEGVLKKREYVPVLSFEEKEEEGNDSSKIYKIKFKIDKENSNPESKKVDRSENLDKDSDEQLLTKLKSKKTTDVVKEKIMKLLTKRDVKYKNPFDEEDDTKSDEELAKEAEKLASSTKVTVKKGKEKVTESLEKCEKECQCNEEELNEGLLGKLGKIFSRKEYDKTLDYVMNSLDGDCTKEKVKDALSNMVFHKITKNAIKDDSTIMKSLEDEIYKDCKKKCDSNESVFGTEEWNKKYGVKIEKEETEISLNSLVNETIKIQKIDEFSLNEKINQVIEDNIIPSLLETKKK